MFVFLLGRHRDPVLERFPPLLTGFNLRRTCWFMLASSRCELHPLSNLRLCSSLLRGSSISRYVVFLPHLWARRLLSSRYGSPKSLAGTLLNLPYRGRVWNLREDVVHTEETALPRSMVGRVPRRGCVWNSPSLLTAGRGLIKTDQQCHFTCASPDTGCFPVSQGESG